VNVANRWIREPGPRVEGDRPLDESKVQAPGVVALPGGGFRLFYTAIGPAKPYPRCQGYILSAVSDDGVAFRKEPGIRLAPREDIPWMSRRTLVPAVTPLPDGRWRMYFESRGPATRPTVICSAISSDLLAWTLEDGIRLERPDDVGGQRFVRLPDGRGRIYCFSRATQSIVSAVTDDGLAYEWEPGSRLVGGAGGPGGIESAGITAADVLPPTAAGEPWTMYYSAWQDVPPGTVVPPHPSMDPAMDAAGGSDDFARASIAADMAGYRSRIFRATSPDGLEWERAGLELEGGGHDAPGIDAVHAEDMSVIRLGDGRLRMYYASCDAPGNWRVASAVTSS
jgi:hypothetical protein